MSTSYSTLHLLRICSLSLFLFFSLHTRYPHFSRRTYIHTTSTYTSTPAIIMFALLCSLISILNCCSSPYTSSINLHSCFFLTYTCLHGLFSIPSTRRLFLISLVCIFPPFSNLSAKPGIVPLTCFWVFLCSHIKCCKLLVYLTSYLFILCISTLFPYLFNHPFSTLCGISCVFSSLW